jgi:hypothetical protein
MYTQTEDDRNALPPPYPGVPGLVRHICAAYVTTYIHVHIRTEISK